MVKAAAPKAAEPAAVTAAAPAAPKGAEPAVATAAAPAVPPRLYLARESLCLSSCRFTQGAVRGATSEPACLAGC